MGKRGREVRPVGRNDEENQRTRTRWDGRRETLNVGCSPRSPREIGAARVVYRVVLSRVPVIGIGRDDPDRHRQLGPVPGVPRLEGCRGDVLRKLSARAMGVFSERDVGRSDGGPCGWWRGGGCGRG